MKHYHTKLVPDIWFWKKVFFCSIFSFFPAHESFFSTAWSFSWDQEISSSHTLTLFQGQLCDNDKYSDKDIDKYSDKYSDKYNDRCSDKDNDKYSDKGNDKYCDKDSDKDSWDRETPFQGKLCLYLSFFRQ